MPSAWQEVGHENQGAPFVLDLRQHHAFGVAVKKGEVDAGKGIFGKQTVALYELQLSAFLNGQDVFF